MTYNEFTLICYNKILIITRDHIMPITFHTKHDFQDIPTSSAKEAEHYINKMQQNNFIIAYNSQVVATQHKHIKDINIKLKQLIGNGPSHSDVTDIKSNIKGLRHILDKSNDEGMFKVPYHPDGNNLNTAIQHDLQSTLERLELHAVHLINDEHINNSDGSDALSAIKKLIKFNQSLPNDAKELARFPQHFTIESIERIESNAYVSGDEYSPIRTEELKIRINDEVFGLIVVDKYVEMGSKSYTEAWTINDKHLRSGSLPARVEVSYDNSPEDNAPSFYISTGVALLDYEYKNMYESYQSRSLVCQYMGRESEEYQDTLQNMELNNSLIIGSSIIKLQRGISNNNNSPTP